MQLDVQHMYIQLEYIPTLKKLEVYESICMMNFIKANNERKRHVRQIVTRR